MSVPASASGLHTHALTGMHTFTHISYTELGCLLPRAGPTSVEL